MKNRYSAHLTLLLLTCSSAYATQTGSCDGQLATSLQEYQRIVGSMRYDKASQMRVFAPDGSEFTAGQVQWMKGQLQLIAKACANGDTAGAAQRLAEVEQLIKDHHRSFAAS
jgi:hypothetical protein